MLAPPIRKPEPIASPVRGLLQRKYGCGNKALAGGTCASCGDKEKGLQRKLSIGSSNDPLEREADWVAELVMSPAGADFTAVPISVQRSAAPSDGSAREAPSSLDRTLAMSGTALETSLRQDMEARFGRDFAHVRTHAGADAERSARQAGAHAYTVGSDIVFGAGQFAPDTWAGRRLLAHELTHVVQQSAGVAGIVQRDAIDDIKKYLSYDFFSDWEVTDQDAKLAFQLLRALPEKQQAAVLLAEGGLYLNRLRDNLPFVYLPNLELIAAQALVMPRLEARQKSLEKDTAKGSKKSFGDVGGSLARLKMVKHELAIRKTGKGIYVGKENPVQPRGAIPTDCTDMVIEVLGDLFRQKDREKDWEKVKAVYTAAGGKKLSGLHIQTALQTELGWVGIYWAPDPRYAIPREELGGWDPANPEKGIQSPESAQTFNEAQRKDGKQGTYYRDPAKGVRGINIDHAVVRYSPQVPNEPRKPKYPEASTTPKDTSGLEKLKKLPFGVLTAHGAFHMGIISYGKIIEAHWNADATDIRLITETDLETWEKGERSGYHWLASGAIVAPADEVKEAFGK